MKEHDETKQPDHQAGSRKGEEVVQDEGKESGREDTGTSHADRPAGTRTSRDSTSINPDKTKPIHPDSPEMPPA